MYLYEYKSEGEATRNVKDVGDRDRERERETERQREREKEEHTWRVGRELNELEVELVGERRRGHRELQEHLHERTPLENRRRPLDARRGRAARRDSRVDCARKRLVACDADASASSTPVRESRRAAGRVREPRGRGHGGQALVQSPRRESEHVGWPVRAAAAAAALRARRQHRESRHCRLCSTEHECRLYPLIR